MTVMAEKAPGAASPAESRQAWRRAGLLFALATALLFALHLETVAAMVETWMISDTYGYGFLILPLVLLLAFQRRRQLALLIPRPCFWAFIWIAGALLLQLVGSVASVMLFKQLAFVALWQGLFALFMGWPVVRQMLFALFYLFFAVPVGAVAVPLLQTITAEITVFLLRASEIPTFLDGVFIEIPAGSFVVAEVCSGVRFLITSLVLGALVAHLFFRSWRRRGLFMVLSLVVPILANGLRAYGIIMLAHLSDYRLAISVDHIVYGLIFLSLVLLILIGLGALFRDRWPPEETPEPVVPDASARVSSSLGAFLLAVLLLGGGKVWALQVTAPPPAAGPVELAVLRPGGDWSLAGRPLAGWDPAFPGADSQLLRAYQAPEGEVALFIAHYLYQRDGHEIIATRNSFAGKGRDKQVTRFERLEVALAGRWQALRETLVQTPAGPRLIWSWYEIGGTPTISPVAGKFFEIWHTLSGGSRAATAFALSTVAGDDLRGTRARLKAFLSALEANQGLGVTLAQTDKTKTADEARNKGSQ